MHSLHVMNKKVLMFWTSSFHSLSKIHITIIAIFSGTGV
jgi:hypothetical protein